MSKFNFRKLSDEIKKATPQILEVMANNAVNFFKVDNFEAQAFIDDTPKRWPARKSKRNDAGRKLLVDTGRGRASIMVVERTGDSIKVGTRVKYMEYHNKGTKKIPQRQFIGESKVLARKNMAVLDKMLNSIVKAHSE